MNQLDKKNLIFLIDPIVGSFSVTFDFSKMRPEIMWIFAKLCKG